MVGPGLGIAVGEIAVAVGIGVAGSPPQAASMDNVATNQTVATRVHHLPNTPSTISRTRRRLPNHHGQGYACRTHNFVRGPTYASINDLVLIL